MYCNPSLSNSRQKSQEKSCHSVLTERKKGKRRQKTAEEKKDVVSAV